MVSALSLGWLLEMLSGVKQSTECFEGVFLRPGHLRVVNRPCSDEECPLLFCFQAGCAGFKLDETEMRNLS